MRLKKLGDIALVLGGVYWGVRGIKAVVPTTMTQYAKNTVTWMKSFFSKGINNNAPVNHLDALDDKTQSAAP